MNALTRSITVMMLCGMLLQINSVLVCFGLFTFNQKVIAEAFCERKVKDCCGHCFLLKKLDTANDIQSAPSGKQASTKTQEELVNAMPAILPKLQLAFQRLSSGNKFASDWASFLPDGVTIQIDHPPKA
jgi:hypothetical protein